MGNSSRGSIPYKYAQESLGQRIVGVMIKPVGSLCNLDCAYCYYLDKEKLYSGQTARMDIQLLEKFTQQYIEANLQADEISFCWHGGEPLLAGLDFFKKAVSFQKKYNPGKQISNSLQTNGTLINREWVDFFLENNFLVGVSIDGPQAIHDTYRRNKRGQGTYKEVLKGIEMMYKDKVQYNTLTTVNHVNQEYGKEIYLFLKSIGSYHMQFLPVLEYIKSGIVPPGTPGSHVAPWSVSSQKYGKFLCDIFDLWSNGDVGIRFIPFFESVLANYLGIPPGICAWCETCGNNVALEWNGDVYLCDHFVYPEYKIGNIAHMPFSQMACSNKLFRFGMEKRNGLPDLCFHCPYYRLCYGECPKHRFLTAPDGQPGLNALCEGYKQFFAYTEDWFVKMAKSMEKNGLQ
ncbi:MAG TPA: anaerobic sulfatase maturase [Bacteroidales bacterium]|nr:anaerobic sulfatase maturase [Bacteroidales bacterium]HRW95222.1 anaerobic sulfatase maturase [Bacteroidales bacterium]